MYKPEHKTIELQVKTMPAGYCMVTEGKLQPGDIRWNTWNEEWNLTDPTTSPKHDIVIGDSIQGFKGVCRKG